MNTAQRIAQRSFRRVQQFLAANPVANAPTNLGKQSKELDEVVAKLSQEAQEQETGVRQTRGETKRQQALREALWSDHMKPISRIAREAFGLPGMDKALKMPKKSKDNEALLAAAGSMAEAAERQPEVFVEHGLPQEFVQQLRSAIATLNEAVNARDDSTRRRTIATASTRELVKRGRHAVRLLDAILAPRLGKDPELLSAWRSVKRPNEQGGGSGVIGSEEQTAPVVKVA